MKSKYLVEREIDFHTDKIYPKEIKNRLATVNMARRGDKPVPISFRSDKLLFRRRALIKGIESGVRDRCETAIVAPCEGKTKRAGQFVCDTILCPFYIGPMGTDPGPPDTGDRDPVIPLDPSGHQSVALATPLSEEAT